MKINCFSITFWFDIFDSHNNVIEILQKKFTNEFAEFNVANYTNNLLAPIITAVNNKKRTNIVFSQINFQYNMDNVTLNNLDEFKEKCLNIYEMLISANIKVKHTAVFANEEIIDEHALQNLTFKTLKNSLIDDNLVDVSLKIGKKHEDLFYKIINVLNKKQIKLPRLVDEKGRAIPIPLISWNGAMVENEIIEISYEINDKYLFDFTKNYHTTEFYLNKMLYLFCEDLKDDINNILV